MNPEYTKFTQSKIPYNPPVTSPGHFSHLPDVLIPSEHVEVGVNPIEKEDDEIIRDIITPPPTPPELTPGTAGCSAFRGDRTYNLDPIFQDQAYMTLFMAKIILLDCLYFIPTTIMLSVACAWRPFDVYLVRYSSWLYFINGFGTCGVFLYLYVIGLCRNAPFLQIAFVIRCILTLLAFGTGLLLIHYWFLLSHLDKDLIDKFEHIDDEDDYKEDEAEHPEDREEFSVIDYNPTYSPPYMGLLIILMFWVYAVILSFMFAKLGITWNDYRVPVLIYTICFIVSPLMITLVLNNVLNTKPLGYDLFQIMIGTFILNILGMGTPKHLEKLLEGKLCPLNKDELLYGVLHYGMA